MSPKFFYARFDLNSKSQHINGLIIVCTLLRAVIPECIYRGSRRGKANLDSRLRGNDEKELHLCRFYFETINNWQYILHAVIPLP